MKKNGRHKGRQQYKCKDCGKYFNGGNRLNADLLWQLYTDGKQTVAQLAQSHGCSRKTISRYLQKAQAASTFATPQVANIIMDTTYFGANRGIMVLYDSISKQALFVETVTRENNALYLQALRGIQEKGTTIQSITCDGRRGVDKLLPGIPMQLCQFHQMQTINRYLTRRPKSLAAHELRALALTLKTASQQEFAQALSDWHTRHKTYLNERSFSPITQKSRYTHKRLRRAYRSLQSNLEKLFAFERYPHLCIPKTTNLLEGRFSDLKRRLRCHQGMCWGNKVRFIKDYFSKI